MKNNKLYFENLVEVQRAILHAGADPFAVCRKYEFEDVITYLSDNDIAISASYINNYNDNLMSELELND
jgi:hypothetical protein